MSRTNITSPTYAHHVGYETLASTSHVESMLPSIVDDFGGIHIVEKPKCVRCKLKLYCSTCEGDHLAHFYPTIAGILEAWSSPRDPLGSESSVVSQHYVSPFIDTEVMPI
jgi:hypothetical protein